MSPDIPLVLRQAEIIMEEQLKKKEVKKYSEEQINLINELVKINVSKVTAENLIRSNDQDLIKKWIEAINYFNAGG